MKTLATTVARLREWAEVESVPAEDEFYTILADLEMLVRQEADLVEPASTNKSFMDLLRMMAFALSIDENVSVDTRVMAGALHKSFKETE